MRVGDKIAIGSDDSLVSLWDLNEFVCLRTLGAVKTPVRTVSVSYDGNVVAYCGDASDEGGIEIAHCAPRSVLII